MKCTVGRSRRLECHAARRLGFAFVLVLLSMMSFRSRPALTRSACSWRSATSASLAFEVATAEVTPGVDAILTSESAFRRTDVAFNSGLPALARKFTTRVSSSTRHVEGSARKNSAMEMRARAPVRSSLLAFCHAVNKSGFECLGD